MAQRSGRSVENSYIVLRARNEIGSDALEAGFAEEKCRHISVVSEGVSTNASEGRVSAY